MIVFLHNFTGASAGAPKDCIRRQFSCDGVDARTSVVSQPSKTTALLDRAMRQGSGYSPRDDHGRRVNVQSFPRWQQEGGPQTASGELYDPLAWTAAIKTELRNRFRGVRYGRLYQPTFALVQSGNKQLIVKINDVGPLRP